MCPSVLSYGLEHPTTLRLAGRASVMMAVVMLSGTHCTIMITSRAASVKQGDAELREPVADIDTITNV